MKSTVKWYKYWRDFLFIKHDPDLNYAGIGVWPFVFIKDIEDVETMKHELGHHKQQGELLLIGWYLLYGIFYAILWLRKMDVWAEHPMELDMEDYEDIDVARVRWGWYRYFGRLFAAKKT